MFFKFHPLSIFIFNVLRDRKLLKDFFLIGYFAKPEDTVLTSLENTADEKHLTILPRFTMDDTNIDSFAESVASVLNEMKVSGVNEYAVDTIRTEEFISPMGRHKVQIVDKTEEIETLHLSILEIAEKLSAVFRSPAFSGMGYNPHISHAEEGFASKLSYFGLTTYQDVPFRTEIKVVFDLDGNIVPLSEDKIAA